jgi:hypothetical protein
VIVRFEKIRREKEVIQYLEKVKIEGKHRTDILRKISLYNLIMPWLAKVSLVPELR